MIDRTVSEATRELNDFGVAIADRTVGNVKRKLNRALDKWLYLSQ